MGNGPRQQAAGRDKAKSIRSFKGIGRQIEARRQETERKQEESEWLRNVERMREDTRRRAVQWLEDMEKQVVKGQGESEKRREIEAEKRRETEMREQLREAQRRRDAKLEAQRLVTIRSAAEIIKQQKFTAWIKHPFLDNTQSASSWVSRPTVVREVVRSTPTFLNHDGGTQIQHEEVQEFNHGERIPPELFDIILFYVIENSASYCSPGHGHRASRLLRLRRPGAGWTENDTDATSSLQACSLVCRYWAILCRRSLFSGATLIIGSSEDMEIFKQYVTQGSSSARLQPIHRLIGAIYVVQSYSDTQSFCHHLHALIPTIEKSLFEELFLVGPVPAHFPRCQLGTPHWSIPSSIVTPPSLLPFRCISLLNVHLPSLRHVSQYIRHLSCATYIRFENVTWDVGTTTERGIPHLQGMALRYGQNNVSIFARGCTDNMHLCLYAALIRHGCPLHALPDNERNHIIWLVDQLWQLHGNANDLYHMIHWDRRDCISIGLHSGHQCLFTFQLSFDSLILNMPTSDIHLSGFRSIFYVYEAGIDCHAVTKLLRSFHTLRVIHFDFVSNYHVEAAGLSWPVLLAPPLQYCEFVLTPARRDPLDPVGATVDPLILDPTGRNWENVDDIVSYLLEHPRSQRSIQRANEKRMSWQLEDVEADVDSEADSTGTEADSDWEEYVGWEVDKDSGWDSDEPQAA